jgi:hypothetical protein
MGQSRISTPRPRSPVPRPPPLLHHPQTYHLLLLTAHFFPSPVLPRSPRACPECNAGSPDRGPPPCSPAVPPPEALKSAPPLSHLPKVLSKTPPARTLLRQQILTLSPTSNLREVWDHHRRRYAQLTSPDTAYRMLALVRETTLVPWSPIPSNQQSQIKIQQSPPIPPALLSPIGKILQPQPVTDPVKKSSFRGSTPASVYNFCEARI